MFHSIYHKQTAPQAAQETASANRAFLNWPATYSQGFQSFDPHQYQLNVCGLVERPHTFSFQELMALTRIQQNRRLVFADGYTFRSSWEGFVVQELLHRAAPKPQARFLIQTNLSGQVECLPLKDLYSQRALFCVRVNHKPLPELYGGPIRLMVFDRYAHKGLGQIVSLELSDHEIPGDFSKLGYEASGEIQAGEYYASDLRSLQQIKTAGEVTQW
jgi:DMSO/TMAO reductase YedYZ molybdopterin-dependent catalytic subunit